MSIPQPPDDPETRNIIEKLATFVARNGPEFEAATRQKHENNPKFSFLRGGEYQQYYLFRVQAEKNLLQQAPNPFHMPPPPLGHTHHSRPPMPFSGPPPPVPGSNVPPPPLSWNQPPPGHGFPSGPPPPPMPMPPIPPPPMMIEQAFQQQIQALQERIRQSEINLVAQRDAMQLAKKTKSDENIRAARQARIAAQAKESSIDMNELDRSTAAIIDACTKDNISAGRNCIFNSSQTLLQIQTVCLYLIDRVFGVDNMSDARLHLIYLINDILHNCLKRGNDELRQQLSSIIIPVYCLSVDQSNDDRKQKLIKLLDLWEKNRYFSDDVMEKLRDTAQARKHMEDAIRTEYAPIIGLVESGFDEKYGQLEKQHAEFAQHIQTQINQIQQQIMQIHQVQQQTVAPPPLPPPPPPPHLLNNNFGPPMPPNMMPRMSIPPQSNNPNQQPPPLMSLNPFNDGNRDHSNLRPPQTHGPPSNMFDNPPPSLMSMSMPSYDNTNNGGNNNNNNNYHSHHHHQHHQHSHQPYQHQQMQHGHDSYVHHPHSMHGEEQIFDIKRVSNEIPYYDLPAGLMCLLVKDEDCDYNSIDPNKIQLSSSEPMSERLMSAIENFYMPPTHEAPRDADGWERLGLFEYFKKKNTYKFSKDRLDRMGTSSYEEKTSSKSESKQKSDRTHSRSSSSKSSSSSSSRSSRSSSSSSSSSRSSSKSSSRSSSGSRSSNKSSSSSKRNSKHNQQRKRSRSRSPSPIPHKQYQHSYSSTKSARSRSRSPTSPSFSSSYSSHNAGPGMSGSRSSHPVQQQKLTDSNVGHKLLQKMGWQEGIGLGRREQGIVEPIVASNAANNESKTDQYKGVGHEADPFEQFRRQKAKGYVSRLIAAQAELAAKRLELSEDDHSTHRYDDKRK